jgi:hypothetical protein
MLCILNYSISVHCEWSSRTYLVLAVTCATVLLHHA